MLGADQADNQLQVVQELPEATYVAANAARAAVPPVIVGVDGPAARGEPATEVLITTAVLREAVNQQENALGLGGEPRATKEQGPTGTGKVGFHSADYAVLHAIVPSPDCELSARSRRGFSNRPDLAA
jgi:hypothetical protein